MHSYKVLYSLYDYTPSFSGLLIPGLFLIGGILMVRFGWRKRKESFTYWFMLFIGIAWLGLVTAMAVHTNLSQYRRGQKADALRARGAVLVAEGPVQAVGREAHRGESELDFYDFTQFTVAAVPFRVDHNKVTGHTFDVVSVKPGDLVDGRHARIEYYMEGKETIIVRLEADMSTPTAADKQRAKATQDSLERIEDIRSTIHDSVMDAHYNRMRDTERDSVNQELLPSPDKRIDAITDSIFRARKIR